jgi:DNA-binding NarL/FixJ family response regulator
MDVTMNDLNGLEATKRILKELPGTRVIILSMHSKEEYVLQALRAGASGYLLKDAAATELRNAIDAVGRGETYLSSALSKRVIDVYLQRGGNVPEPAEELTSRQKEILQLITEGKSTKEIAVLLKVSVKTVEAHRSQMMDRLNIHDIPGLVRYAMRTGLITAS